MKTNTSHQQVIVQSGGKNVGQEIINEKKKIETFIEPSVGIDTKGEMEVMLRCGLRF